MEPPTTRATSPTSSYKYLPIDMDGRIAQELQCIECSHELSGEFVNDFCPECKTVIAESVVGRAVCEVNSEGQLNETVVCKSCGYELKGLMPEGQCPECGAPVGYSLEINLLRYCNYKWLVGIKTGFTLYFVGTLLSILMGIIAAVVGIITQNQALQIMVGAAVGSLVGILMIVSVYQITAPETKHLRGDTLPSGLRITARLCVVLMLCSQIASSLGALNPKIAPLLSIPAGLIGLVVFVSTFTYSRKLAMLIPDYKLAGHIKVLVWLYICFIIVASIGGVIVLMSGVATMGQSPAGGGGGGLPPGTSLPLIIGGALFGCTGGIGMLVVTIWSLIIMFKFIKHFSEVARIATQTQMRGLIPENQNQMYG